MKEKSEKDIQVSICSLVYNHAKYLRKCLEGFVNQKTNFDYEIWIHDDASTDGSVEIIKEYAEKYPDLFHLVLQKENQYSKGKDGKGGLHNAVFPYVKGKYIALCEGDDYWVDEYKLQKQFDAMEANPNCALCGTRVEIVNEQGISQKEQYPKFAMKTGVILADEWREKMKYISFIQTSTYFFRAEIVKKEIEENREYLVGAPIGDVLLQMRCAEDGDLYFIDEITSCYRTASEGSFSQRLLDKEKRIEVHKKLIEIFHQYNEYTNYQYDDFCKERIAAYEYIIARTNNRFYEMIKSKYKGYRKTLPFKSRFKLYVFLVFPFAENIHQKVKSMIGKIK